MWENFCNYLPFAHVVFLPMLYFCPCCIFADYFEFTICGIINIYERCTQSWQNSLLMINSVWYQHALCDPELTELLVFVYVVFRPLQYRMYHCVPTVHVQ